jgi:integrase
LRRAELSALTVEDPQVRQGPWAIVDLVGKGGHVRTGPMPAWVKDAVDRWRESAKVTILVYSDSDLSTAYNLAIKIQIGPLSIPKTG